MNDTCPHCHATLPAVKDAYCPECLRALDEPPDPPLSPAEQAERSARSRRFAACVAIGAGLGLLTNMASPAGSGTYGAGYLAGGAFVGGLLGYALACVLFRKQ